MGEWDKVSGRAFQALFQAKDPIAETLDRMAGREPTRKNVEAAWLLVRVSRKYRPVADLLSGILEGRFRQEWRFMFGGRALGPDRTTLSLAGKASAALAAFSTIRQAIRYSE